MLKRSMIMLLCSGLIVLGVVGCGSSDTGSTGSTSTDNTSGTAVSSPTLSPSPSLTPVAPHVMGVIIAITPSSFSGIACGASTNVVFTATISIVGGSTGGSVPYTWNINHSNIAGSVAFAPGETSKTVRYMLSNYVVQLNSASLVSGSIMAGNAGNTINSSAIGPSGVCRLPGPFQVVSISISMSPTTVAGIACGTTITAVYTATISIAPDSNAGTVQLTWNISPSHFLVSANFAPTQTVQTISYSVTRALDRTSGFPHEASITSTSPNVVSSALVRASGVCK